MIADVEKGIECNKSDFREHFTINSFRIFLPTIRRVWVVNNEKSNENLPIRLRWDTQCWVLAILVLLLTQIIKWYNSIRTFFSLRESYCYMNEVYILISCPSHLPKEYQKILDARAVAYINVDRAGEGKSSDQ